MRLLADQHRLGVFRWISDEVTLDLEDASGTHPVVAGGYLPNGHGYAVLEEPLSASRGVSMRCLRPWVPGRPFTWYEIQEPSGLVWTDLWEFDGSSLRRIRLAHVPDAGIYHRLVVDAGKLQWQDDLLIRNGRDTIRLINGAVYGPWSRGIKHEEGEQGAYKAIVDAVDGPLEGRFIEVVAAGEDEAGARIRALALLGYINLILGPGAYGQVRIDACIDATRGRRQRYLLYADHQLGFRVNIDDFALDTGLTDLEHLADSGAKSRMMVALERYGQAMAATSEELSFAALFAGIDAVVSDFYKEKRGGTLGRQRKQEADKFVATNLCGVDDAMRARIREMLMSPSLLDKFSFYIREQGMEDSLVEDFKVIRGPRNDLFHGASADKIHVSVGKAKGILEKVICKEAGIDRRKTWRFDRGVSTFGEFLLTGYGWETE